MAIFDDILRPDHNPPSQGESAFSYLNRSGRVEAARVRATVEDWLGRYPEPHRPALVARLRSLNDNHHLSAYFELFVHQLLLVRGCQIIEVEPNLGHTGKSPDFLAEKPDGGRVYVECVLATGQSDRQAAAEQRLNAALKVIDEACSPGHFLDLKVRGIPASTLATKPMKRALNTWIAGLPGDRTSFDVPPFVHEEHGVRITVRAWPRSRPAQSNRSIGVRHFPARSVEIGKDVRSALEKKALRYGRLDHPYVVAVNALGTFAKADDAIDALFGTPAVRVRELRNGQFLHDEVRELDGIWHGKGGPQRTGLSAVLSAAGVDPWNLARRRALLIQNPWAALPLAGPDLGIDRLQVDGDLLRRVEGSALGDILGLPQGWPED